MVIIEELREKFKHEEFEFSKHAVDQTILRNISIQEICETIIEGEIIENYPNDKYEPSCLILGFTRQNRPIHVQCSYPSRPKIKVITVYEPEPSRWIDYKKRR